MPSAWNPQALKRLKLKRRQARLRPHSRPPASESVSGSNCSLLRTHTYVHARPTRPQIAPRLGFEPPRTLDDKERITCIPSSFYCTLLVTLSNARSLHLLAPDPHLDHTSHHNLSIPTSSCSFHSTVHALELTLWIEHAGLHGV